MPPVNYGVWGKPTSTLDWCEENYVVTPLIAEFWNTISNWIMIVPPIIAAIVSWKRKMELRIILSYLSIGLVGLGSFAFHCTLLYNMQLLDELPMIYGTCILLYGMLQINSKENVMNLQLVVFFAILSLLITVIYLVVINPLFFMMSYAALAISLFGLTVYNYKKLYGSGIFVSLSVSSYLLGFVLWNIDNNFCPQMSSHLRLKCLGHPSILKVYYNFIPVILKKEGEKNFDMGNMNNNFNLMPRNGALKLVK